MDSAGGALLPLNTLMPRCATLLAPSKSSTVTTCW